MEVLYRTCPGVDKAVRGRNTDVDDAAAWIADLAANGLIRPSFVSDRDIQALRDLTRACKQLVREGASHANRIEQVLQTANTKPNSVLSDIVSSSGRAILDTLAEAETDPAILVLLAHRNVRAPRAKIVESLRGSPAASSSCSSCISGNRMRSILPSNAHSISWAGLCPRNDESAAKRRLASLRKGGAWLSMEFAAL